MNADEESLEISDGDDGQVPTPPTAIERAEHGPNGRFLPGNHAAGEHLFKPGVSGNPKGPPSMKKFTHKLREVLEKNDGEMLKAMVNVACQRALRGDFRYFKEIIDRVEGKVADRLDLNAEQEIRVLSETERIEAHRLADLLLLSPSELEECIAMARGEGPRPAGNNSPG